MMKKIALVLGGIFLLTSCGTSEAEVKEQVVDKAVNSVCNCFEKYQSDFLAYRQECNETIRSMRVLLEDNEEGLKQFEESISECDKYHKD